MMQRLFMGSAVTSGAERPNCSLTSLAVTSEQYSGPRFHCLDKPT